MMSLRACRATARGSAVAKNADADFWAAGAARQIQEVSEELIHHSPWLDPANSADSTPSSMSRRARFGRDECAQLARLANMAPAQWPASMKPAVESARDARMRASPRSRT